MLEQLLARELADKADVMSAGIAAASGSPASAHSQTCMSQQGLDLSRHLSTSLYDIDLDTIDLFYCMSPHHGGALIDAGVPGHKIFVVNGNNGGIPDPFGGSLAAYENTAQVLEQCAQAIAKNLG